VEELAPHIRSTLYFNMKARKLQAFCRHLLERCGGDMDALKERPMGELRTELLGLYGIGPETADSILLYAVGMPIFVVDAYTRRIFSRYGIVPPDIDYHDLQAVFMERLPADTAFFNEYHALIVMLGKACCTARKPRCGVCPLGEDCRRRYL
jgi:endonuclease-3 related protein